MLEEFAKISSASAFPLFEANVGPVHALVHFASDRLKQEVVPKVCRGEMVLAVSMSEPQAGSADRPHHQGRGERRQGHLERSKALVFGRRPLGWVFGLYAPVGRPRGEGHWCRVCRERTRPGLSFGAQEELMGFRGVPSADIFLDNVTVPEDNIVVPAGGFRKLMEAFDLERCGNATMALGQASGALEDVLDYVQERQQFGKELVDFQGVQIKLAEMQMKVEAARLLIHRAAVNAQDGLPSVIDSSVGKCFANEICREVTGAAVQLMGGYGYSKAYPMERRMRDAWGWGIAGGAIDIQKTNIAAAMVGRRFDQRR